MNAHRLRELIRAELPDLVELRRDLHRHPELGYEERRTSGIVRRELAALGIEVRTGIAGTGVLGHLPATDPAGRDAPAVALRADMDALPIAEATGKPYASATPGVMHACGHDGHTAILLGAARVLTKLPRPRPVTLVFQPAEEGGAGAARMCGEGALAGREGGGIGAPVGRIYGLHGWPAMDLGAVGTRPGPMLAATDEFDIEIAGVGGHAALPHLARDPIVAAAHVVAALQTIASRAVNPTDALVCTVGTINAGTANNVIPASARLTGTIRSLSPAVRETAKQRLFSIAEGTALGLGCAARVGWHDGYPVTHNDPAEAERVLAVARDALGRDEGGGTAGRVRVLDAPIMGGEDFSFYGKVVPACFFFLGLRPAGDPDGGGWPLLHSPQFDFNDDAIALGVEMMCRLAASPA